MTADAPSKLLGPITQYRYQALGQGSRHTPLACVQWTPLSKRSCPEVLMTGASSKMHPAANARLDLIWTCGCVAGNRLWARDTGAPLTCAAWSPDGLALCLGTADGQCLFKDAAGSPMPHEPIPSNVSRDLQSPQCCAGCQTCSMPLLPLPWSMFLFTTAFTSCIMQGAGPDCDGVVGLSWQHGTAAEAAQSLCICYADGRQDPQESHCILCEPSGP